MIRIQSCSYGVYTLRTLVWVKSRGAVHDDVANIRHRAKSIHDIWDLFIESLVEIVDVVCPPQDVPHRVDAVLNRVAVRLGLVIGEAVGPEAGDRRIQQTTSDVGPDALQVVGAIVGDESEDTGVERPHVL